MPVPDRRYPGSQPPRQASAWDTAPVFPCCPRTSATKESTSPSQGPSFNLMQSDWRAMVPPVFLSSLRIPCFGGNSIPVGESRDTGIPLDTAHPRTSVHSVCPSRPVPCASLIGRTLFRNRTASVPTFPPEWKEHVLEQPMKRWHFCNYPVLVLMFLKYHLPSLSILYGEKTSAACPYAHIHAYRGFSALGYSVQNNRKDCSGMLPICMKPNR